MVQLYSLWDNPPIKYSDYLKKKGSVYTMDIIEKITASQIKKDLPEFRVGDSVIEDVLLLKLKVENLKKESKTLKVQLSQEKVKEYLKLSL